MFTSLFTHHPGAFDGKPSSTTDAGPSARGSGSCGCPLSLFSGAVCRRPVPPPPTHHNRPRWSWKRQAKFAADHSPAARARKARRRLRRLFVVARRKAKGRARLCRADEYEVLRCAYRAVRAWRSDGVQRDETNDLALRFEAAKAAAPYVHPKLAAIQHLDERSGALSLGCQRTVGQRPCAGDGADRPAASVTSEQTGAGFNWDSTHRRI